MEDTQFWKLVDRYESKEINKTTLFKLILENNGGDIDLSISDFELAIYNGERLSKDYWEYFLIDYLECVDGFDFNNEDIKKIVELMYDSDRFWEDLENMVVYFLDRYTEIKKKNEQN